MLKLFQGLFKGKEKTEQTVRPTRQAWFGRIARLLEGPGVDEGLWEELEELLISADVGVSTTAEVVDRAKARAKQGQLDDRAQVRSALKQEMVNILKVDHLDSPPPAGLAVILVVGVNGVGKTTSIAKLAHHLKGQGKGVMLAAGDTFRAAAAEQLQLWGERIGIEVIAHQPGSDPGAVAFDAMQAASRRGAEVLIIDTSGRIHTKFNLMEELKKVRRVVSKADPTAPHEVLLVLDATTGQNGLSQAQHFTEAVGVTGIFLAKLDGTAKGGIVLAICHELKIPILYIGTGQGLDDWAPFDAEEFVEALFSPGD